MRRENWRDIMVVARVFGWLCLAASGWFIAAGEFARAGSAFFASAAFYLVQRLARDHMLGWITDAKGERQKVVFETAESNFYQQQMRDARIVEAAKLAQDRRKGLGRCGIALVLIVAALVYLSSVSLKNDLGGIEVIGFLLLLMGGGFAIVFLWFLGWEALYHLGYQNIPGAKVLDPPVHSAGLADVKAQMAHGDARLASEAEALRILGGQNGPDA